MMLTNLSTISILKSYFSILRCAVVCCAHAERDNLSHNIPTPTGDGNELDHVSLTGHCPVRGSIHGPMFGSLEELGLFATNSDRNVLHCFICRGPTHPPRFIAQRSKPEYTCHTHTYSIWLCHHGNPSGSTRQRDWGTPFPHRSEQRDGPLVNVFAYPLR